MPTQSTDMIVNRADLSDARFVTTPLPDPLEDGTCLLAIDQFALTANNITYAVAPESIGYWKFFPTSEAGFGRVPVWGFGDVIASAHPDVSVGTRVYGYFPMSSHLVISPGQITANSMMDVAPHRAEMSPIYSQYSFAPADTPKAEAITSLLRPLFTTSFLIDDWHRREDVFGAETVILTSASSKTAMGVAYLMSQDRPQGLKIIGLTSPGNAAFTKALGYYDEVHSYDDVPDLAMRKTALIDMAGNSDVLRSIHAHFDSYLMNSCRVGLTHWGNASNFIDGLTGGPKPAFFFAPTYATDRIKDWGAGQFHARVAQASAAFFSAAQDWMQIEHATGPQAVLDTYRAMLAGQIDPAKGHILSLSAS